MKNDPLISDWLEQQEDSAQMERIIALTENLDAPAQRSKEQAWDILVDRINSEAKDNERVMTPVATNKRSNQWMYWAAGVAAIFLVGFFGIKNISKPISISSEVASTLAYQLPDESIVSLNANSTITFIEKDWEDKREIRLSGEAFFQVEEGSQFTVLTNTGQVQVLGTSFNVKERDGVYEVSCATGKVAVSSGDEEVILTPGQRTYLYATQLKKSTINIDEIGAWRNGDFYFNQAPLETVVKELERQFEIEISLSPDISDRIYNGYFNKENLTEALQLVFVPMGLQFQLDEKQVTVK